MKQLLVFLLLLCSTSVSAQDVIVKKDGSTIVCRVVELTDSEITYKKWSDLNGSNYVMNRADASAINYENGKKVNLSEATNLYTPNNQNDGTQQYNDRALLAIDAQTHGDRVSKMKRNGWISCGIAGAGILFMTIISAANQPDDYGYRGDAFDAAMAGGGILTVGGTVGAILYFSKAHKLKKETSLQVYSSPLFQKDLTLPNGRSLSFGADLLSDCAIGNNTLGIGLRYNF